MVVERKLGSTAETVVERSGLRISRFWDKSKGLVINVQAGSTKLCLNELLPCGWHMGEFQSGNFDNAYADVKERWVRIPTSILGSNGKFVLGEDEGKELMDFMQAEGSLLVVLHEIAHAHIEPMYESELAKFEDREVSGANIKEWVYFMYAREKDVWDCTKRFFYAFREEGVDLEPTMSDEDIERFIAHCMGDKASVLREILAYRQDQGKNES